METESKYLKALVEEIKEEDDPNRSISKLANVVLAMDGQNVTRHKELDGKLDKLSVAILGNGEPDKALVTRICRLELWQKWLLGICGFIGTTSGGYLLLRILGVVI